MGTRREFVSDKLWVNWNLFLTNIEIKELLLITVHTVNFLHAGIFYMYRQQQKIIYPSKTTPYIRWCRYYITKTYVLTTVITYNAETEYLIWFLVNRFPPWTQLLQSVTAEWMSLQQSVTAEWMSLLQSITAEWMSLQQSVTAEWMSYLKFYSWMNVITAECYSWMNVITTECYSTVHPMSVGTLVQCTANDTV